MFTLYIGDHSSTYVISVTLFIADESLGLNDPVVLALVGEEPLEDIGAVEVLGLGGVVGAAVGEHALHVRDEQPPVHVVVGFQPEERSGIRSSRLLVY